jgi:hypothetical protein
LIEELEHVLFFKISGTDRDIPFDIQRFVVAVGLCWSQTLRSSGLNPFPRVINKLAQKTKKKGVVMTKEEIHVFASLARDITHFDLRIHNVSYSCGQKISHGARNKPLHPTTAREIFLSERGSSRFSFLRETNF